MRRGKYRDYYFQVLRHLATLRPTTRFEDLRSAYRIPKGSLSEVLKMLKADEMVKIVYSFPAHKTVTITDRGKREWESSVSRSPEFRLSSAAARYLNVRGLKDESLFPLQRKFVDRGLLYSRGNVCVFGYPGTGKTLVAEMLMANELADGGKVLFCTPYRALDWQKYQDFQSTFGEKLGKRVAITDGDNPTKTGFLEEADVIVATFERVYAAMRLGESWVDKITLACVDELAHLGEEHRGGTLDSLLTGLKAKTGRRVITLSTLVGNPIDIAEWLAAEPVVEMMSNQDVKEYVVFKEGASLVYLRKDGKRTTAKLTGDMVSHIVRQSLEKGLITLVFVGSRHEARRMADRLTAINPRNPELEEEAKRFLESGVIEHTELTKSLCDLIGHGIAFHHAGLQRAARRFVEQLMKDGKLKTVVATTTLSHGIDYRIDSVVIDLPGIIEIRKIRAYDYINIMGRTGRPGLSLEANVFILSESPKVKKVVRTYFFGSPEEVIPENTFDRENLALTVLSEAASGSRTERNVLEKLQNTFRSVRTQPSRRELRKVVAEMSELGFLSKTDTLGLTDLGARVLRSNLSPYDAQKIFGLKPEASEEDLLNLASSIDVARRIGSERRLLRRNACSIIRAFIAEVSLDEIRARFGRTLDDQDIIELTEYAARALQKMADLIPDPRLKSIILALHRKVKFGCKDDISLSELIYLPSITWNKNRILARKLADAGLHNLSDFTSKTAESISRTAGVSVESAETLLIEASCKMQAISPRQT